MKKTKNIIDIIKVEYSCREVIQALYTYKSIRQDHKNARVDEAIELDIIEYNDYDDELSLSSESRDYYKNRLKQQDETNISFISDKLKNLKNLLKVYNIRVRNNENSDKDIKKIYTLLNSIPSLLLNNIYIISSNSVFAFKNESNFEIKMNNLKIYQEEITLLIQASNEVDNFIKQEKNLFKSMSNHKINLTILKLQRNSLNLESMFRTIYRDVKNFINQSIKDGKFIKKLKKLQELKNDNDLYNNTNIEELIKIKPHINLKKIERKLLRDDRVFDFIDKIELVIKDRDSKITNQKKSKAIEYDIKETGKTKKLYNYQKLNNDFLSQDKDLITFLKSDINIEKSKLLGIFVRMIKNFSCRYNMESDDFREIENRIYKKVLAK